MGKKSGNFVFLDGKFVIDDTGRVKDGSMYRPFVSFRVCTDDDKHGGHHKVIAYDRLAEEVVATAKSFEVLRNLGESYRIPLGEGRWRCPSLVGFEHSVIPRL